MKGQSLVEFSVALVFILFLLSGAVEFGIVFFQYVQLRDAAQEGALYGSMCECSSADIEHRALSASDSPINLGENTSVSTRVSVHDKFGISKEPSLMCEGDGLTVVVSYRHRIFMPFLPKLLGGDYISLNADVTNTVLRPLCP